MSCAPFTSFPSHKMALAEMIASLHDACARRRSQLQSSSNKKKKKIIITIFIINGTWLFSTAECYRGSQLLGLKIVKQVHKHFAHYHLSVADALPSAVTNVCPVFFAFSLRYVLT